MALNVFVSGTDHGVGAALANLLADRGMQVFAGVLNPPKISEERRDGGGTLRRLVVDIGSDESVLAAASWVGDHVGHLDWLINNGAILGDIDKTLADKLDFAQMLQVYNVNTLGTLRLTQALLPLLRAGGEKLVANISSEAGSIGSCSRQGWFAYAQSKAALNLQSALVHNTLRPDGGRVLVLHPGHVRTFMRGTEDASGELSPEESAALVLTNIERGRSWSGEHPPFWGPRGEILPW